MTARPILSLARDERGASLIELALAAPIFAAMLIGVIDLSRAYSMKLVIEQVAQRTIERVENQSSVATSSYNTMLNAEATSGMTAAGYSTGNTYTPDSWAECSTDGITWTRTASFTTDCPTGQTQARYASIKIQRSYAPLFKSRAWPGADSSGNITLTGFAQVRMQ